MDLDRRDLPSASATMPGRLLTAPGETRLFVRRHVSAGGPVSAAERPAVLYVHGATFSSGLSIGYPIGGRSWGDELAAAGLDVWGVDFRGFGTSDRYRQQSEPPVGVAPVGRAGGPGGAVEQLVAVLEHVVRLRGGGRVSLLAHSWGTIVAGLTATLRPDLLNRLVLFGPITRRAAPEPTRGGELGAWYPLTVKDQYERFVSDVPTGHPRVLTTAFDNWARDWLADDHRAADRVASSVRVPSGPAADIADAWSGRLAYDPSGVRAPTLIIRGEWDSRTTDDDVRWLFDALVAAPLRREVKLRGGTHLMHLEVGRHALYRETTAFLLGGDHPAP